MQYIQILFEKIDEVKKDMLIAMLGNIGYDGFEEEENLLKAFIPKINFDKNLLDNLIDIKQIKYLKSVIKEKNWNEIWEADFTPIEIYNPITSKPFVCIRAGFHKAQKSFEYDIIITPKMSFGTGHHPTTHLMVEQMSQINFHGKSVIDFGTGTGVLAIIADKMGSAHITAIDCDDWSVNNAIENVKNNNCKNISVIKAETIKDIYKGDIILANINLNIITDKISEIKNACHAGATILFSGIMEHDEKNIIEVLKNAQIKITHIFKRENWLAITTVC